MKKIIIMLVLLVLSATTVMATDIYLASEIFQTNFLLEKMNLEVGQGDVFGFAYAPDGYKWKNGSRITRMGLPIHGSKTKDRFTKALLVININLLREII